jgi:hypothetical protein
MIKRMEWCNKVKEGATGTNNDVYMQKIEFKFVIFYFSTFMVFDYISGGDRGGQAGPWPTPKSLEITIYID